MCAVCVCVCVCVCVMMIVELDLVVIRDSNAVYYTIILRADIDVCCVGVCTCDLHRTKVGGCVRQCIGARTVSTVYALHVLLLSRGLGTCSNEERDSV